jgi:GntR family transcriptional regulator
MSPRPANDAPQVREGPIPKHVQLRGILSELITTDLSPGDALPSERDLMERFDVSRATVREAIGRLVREGHLQRVRGKGTFVAESRVESHLHLASFTEDMRRRGHEPSTRVIDAAPLPAPPEVVEGLGLAHGELTYRLERLRLADGRPMAHEVGWYPARLLPNLQTHDLNGSLYELLRARYGLVIDAGEQTVRAEGCSEERAQLLEVEPGAPLLVFDRISSAGAARVEHMTSWYRGDRYQVHMHVDRAEPVDPRAPT